MSGVSVAKKNGGQTSAIFANDTRWRPNSQILHRRDRSNSRVTETARPSGVLIFTFCLTHEYSSTGFEWRLVFEIVKFGEPEVEIPPFWRRNLAINKTVRKPLSLKLCRQFSYATRFFMPKIVIHQATTLWFVKNEYLMAKIVYCLATAWLDETWKWRHIRIQMQVL